MSGQNEWVEQEIISIIAERPILHQHHTASFSFSNNNNRSNTVHFVEKNMVEMDTLYV